jgi:hypothetical protein
VSSRYPEERTLSEVEYLRYLGLVDLLGLMLGTTVIGLVHQLPDHRVFVEPRPGWERLCIHALADTDWSSTERAMEEMRP